jgi:hypothetical protein
MPLVVTGKDSVNISQCTRQMLHKKCSCQGSLPHSYRKESVRWSENKRGGQEHIHQCVISGRPGRLSVSADRD